MITSKIFTLLGRHQGAALAAILLLGSPMAQAAADGVTVEEIAAAIRHEGLPAQIDTVPFFDDPYIASSIGGTSFDIDFYDCDDDDLCLSYEFGASYDLDDGISNNDINSWNSETIHGKAYRDSDGDPAIDYAVLASGGLSPAAIRATIANWIDVLDSFEKEIGWKRSGDTIQTQAKATVNSVLEVCNRSGDDVSAAYAIATGSTDNSGEPLFRSEGWINLDNDECHTFWESPFKNRYYYFYADAEDGDYGGDYYFCTLDEEFEIVDTPCNPDYQRNGFFQIDMEEDDRNQNGHTIVLK